MTCSHRDTDCQPTESPGFDAMTTTSGNALHIVTTPSPRQSSEGPLQPLEASSQQLSSRSGAMSESEASDSTSPTTPTSTQAESQTEPKYDGGKDRWDLLPMGAMRLVVKALTVGAKKYSGWSWVDQVQAPVPRYYAAAMRHVERWQAGERYDPETGLPHLAHALASLTFVMCHEEGLGVPVWVRRGE